MTTVRHKPTLVDRLRAESIEHFGRFGFDQSMLEISIALDVDVGDELGHTLLREMIGNAETYLETAVSDGTVRPSRDPKGRARLLAMNGAGGSSSTFKFTTPRRTWARSCATTAET